MMRVSEYKAAMETRGVNMIQNWSTMRGEFPFTLHGFRAYDAAEGSYLGLAIVQQMLDPDGKPDGIVTYTETKGNDLDADALAMLGMK